MGEEEEEEMEEGSFVKGAWFRGGRGGREKDAEERNLCAEHRSQCGNNVDAEDGRGRRGVAIEQATTSSWPRRNKAAGGSWGGGSFFFFLFHLFISDRNSYVQRHGTRPNPMS